jgi:hypothetical protein
MSYGELIQYDALDELMKHNTFAVMETVDMTWIPDFETVEVNGIPVERGVLREMLTQAQSYQLCGTGTAITVLSFVKYETASSTDGTQSSGTTMPSCLREGYMQTSTNSPQLQRTECERCSRLTRSKTNTSCGASVILQTCGRTGCVPRTDVPL